MRRSITAILFAALLCAAFSGCGLSGVDWLSYRDGFVSADLTDGERAWRITAVPEGFTAEMLSPPEAAGVTFRITDTTAFAFVGGTEIPVSDSFVSNVRRMVSLFEKGDAQIKEVRSFGSTSDVCVRFVTERGEEVSAVFTANGLPRSFETAGGVYTVEQITVNEDGALRE